jgi:predicted acylesterase/phospholipase RssA
MKKIGLALSGGGFRASLYHLGLLRFLRDAGTLRQVTHITSVSGGSIIAAHVVLNWERYNGSPSEFDAVASEFLSFVRLDVRNRITRRFPLTVPIRWPRKLLGRSNRKLSRTGLLEYHYERYLYGDTSLFELPESPQLHLLSTNLNEGCLCSFSRNGLMMARPQPGHTYYIDRIQIGLATVAMAVTASSAYPGFFPPLELTGTDVGASTGEFGRQSYTDGGVFDNLGVRMFRCLERPLLAENPLTTEDFFDLHGTFEVMRQAGQSSQETPLRRLWQVLTAPAARQEPLLLTSSTPSEPAPAPTPEMAPTGAVAPTGNGEELALFHLWDVMRRYQFYLDPLFANLTPADPDADSYLRATRSGARILDIADRLWLNRHLLEAAFRQATGRPCFRRLNSGLDTVLVSDVGKPIKVQGNRRAGGVIRTALRASDILMDRVWQLEKETFYDTPGFVFAPITQIVEPHDDPTALHPEVQRQARNMRTDLDRFTPLEISSLIRHGYCVARQACRQRPDLFGANLPANPPWDPISNHHRAAPSNGAAKNVDRAHHQPTPATVEARSLQASSLRRIWSTLLDVRDWTSYVYVPIIVPIVFLLPYAAVKAYQHTHRVNTIVRSLSQGSRDLEQMTRLLEEASTPYTGVPFEEVEKPFAADPKGFEILQDSRIVDLRDWNPNEAGGRDPKSLDYVYRRMKVAKTLDYTGDNHFNLNLLPRDPVKTVVRFPSQELQPKLVRSIIDPVAGASEKQARWQAVYDFHQVPEGDPVDILVEYFSPGPYLRRNDSCSVIPIPVYTPTAEFTLWVMMPTEKEYKSWRIVRYPQDKPQNVETVQVVTEYLSDDKSILAFKLLSLKPGYTYEVQWFYK